MLSMRCFAAERIFDGERYLDGDRVLVYHGDRLKEIIDSASVSPDRVTRLNGTLLPGFVNTHCHLELSHLKGLLPEGKGFAAFGAGVVGTRGKFSPSDVRKGVIEADQEMRDNGIALVGDICNTRDTISFKESSSVAYHSFVELIGLHPDSAEKIFSTGKELLSMFRSAGLPASLSAHAPYSVSPRLQKMIVRYDEESGVPFTMHFRETADEIDFLNRSPSQFDELYRALGLNISWFEGVPARFDPAESTVPVTLVHNTFFDEADRYLLALPNLFFCFCPSANRYIQGVLPAPGMFRNATERICLGTDSLAGNDSLDVLKEANLLAEVLGVAPDNAVILKALTINGARALNNSANFGRLAAGVAGGLNLVGMKNKKLTLLKRVI